MLLLVNKVQYIKDVRGVLSGLVFCLILQLCVIKNGEYEYRLAITLIASTINCLNR